MSKPCCPACSELLAILSGDDNYSFAIGGCHSKIFPVQLPPWLPVPVLQAMVARFKGHLQVALVELSEVYLLPQHTTTAACVNYVSSDSEDDCPAFLML